MAIVMLQSVENGVPAVMRNTTNMKCNRFDELVLALKKALGPSSGLTSDDVDAEYLMRLMGEYESSEKEWSRYAMGDESRGYTRNLVDEGNGKSNLVSSTRITPHNTPPQQTTPALVEGC